MSFDNRFHRFFPPDLADASAYYDGVSVALGDQFRDRVRSKLAQVSERPTSFRIVHGPLRAAMIDGFPYLLLFRVIDPVSISLAFITPHPIPSVGSPVRPMAIDR